MRTQVHKNSLAAYNSKSDVLRGKKKLIYDFLLAFYHRTEIYLTDKQVAEFMGYPHVSCVQPRISDLIKEGWLFESVSVEDPNTHILVRTLGALGPSEREEFLSKGQMELNL